LECLILSNRLPVQWDEEEKKFLPSSGGLVSAIRGVKLPDWNFSWLGILTTDAQDAELPQKPFPCTAIKIAPDLYDHYYNGFCNDVLWPLFHYEHTRVTYSARSWNAYISVNEKVAESIAKTAKPNAILWVHDFHFMLVPQLLKRLRPDMRIGFFLHIPFPSSEIFRQLPCRSEILQGVIAADLVGFHDLSYMNHFQASLRRLLGLETEGYKVEGKHHTTHLGVFPISIDTNYFSALSTRAETDREVQGLLVEKKELQWLLGVDRLDYIKGLIMKLRTFKRLLKRHPHLRGKIQLRQIVIPSRTSVTEYRQLKDKIDQLVGAINGEYGDFNYVPVLYQYSSVSESKLAALYRTADAIWVSSRRDGMNLVCLEYVACQNLEHPGSVLLSEFTGAHSTLSYAVSLNPWDIDGSVEKITEALSYPLEQRRTHMSVMKDFLSLYTASTWAQSYLESLPIKVNALKTELLEEVHSKVTAASVIFLDYDGTLAPIQETPELAVPDRRMTDRLVEITQHGVHLPCIVSGRPVDFFEQHFISKGLHLSISANHGASFYDVETKKWRQLVSSEQGDWYAAVKKILALYTQRTPGSFIELKPYGLAWHYRKAPYEFANFVAKKLTIELHEALAGAPVHVISGKKVIEVKHQEANKGRFVDWFMARHTDYKQVLAFGDDETDEDMFKALNKSPVNALNIKVGEGFTAAGLRVAGTAQVLSFLDDLAKHPS